VYPDSDEDQEDGGGGVGCDDEGCGDDSDREMDEALMRKYGIRL
jgi:hypothetical protein